MRTRRRKGGGGRGDGPAARNAASGRTQNFDAWGPHDDFGPLSPDWTASSAKTVLNAAPTVPGGVIISRYIESVGTTKAIEIFNGTTNDINLQNEPYYLQQYNNGATAANATIPLTNGTIPAGRTFAVTRPFPAGGTYPPDAALLQFGDIGGLSSRILRTDKLTFNGDDVIVLRKGSASGRIVDRVGQVGAQATGSLWSHMATDHTLVRNGTVTNGNTSPATSAFDLSEWTVLDNGEFGHLGTHAFTDPDSGCLPGGYSLLLDAGASLTTPPLEGGIDKISFLARAQGATDGPPLRLAIETAPDEAPADWTQVAIFSIPLSGTGFARCECFAGNSAHTVVRFRHVADSSTNRIRLDDIEIGPASSVKRSEDFATWTDPAFASDGRHSLDQWTLDGRIAPNGVSGSLAADLPVDTGSVQSPIFADGVGEISFSLGRPSAADSVQVTLSTSANGGATWDEVRTFGYPALALGTSTNLSVWVCIPSNACVRFDCVGGTADAILDNISVALPSVSRRLDFDAFAPSLSWQTRFHKGWLVVVDAVYDSPVAWAGNSGLLRNGSIYSPWIDAIGALSFRYRSGSGDDQARLQVDVSADGNSWPPLVSALAGTGEWQSYGCWVPTNSDWHYARISQTTPGKRMYLDDIALDDGAPAPAVDFSSALDPAHPLAHQPFRLTATALPLNGADILSVTGFVKYAASGPSTALPMAADGAGGWTGEMLPGRDAGEIIIFGATVWYGGEGVLPGNPAYAVTNLSATAATVTVSSVKSGEVWINEFSCARLVPPDDETDDGGTRKNQDHEFVEICGLAGTDIGNWIIQLAYALPDDIAASSGQAVYAAYAIPAQTTIPDDGNGYGFWLLADSSVDARDQTLETPVPLENQGMDGAVRSHIRDGAGVIRLVDMNGGTMHSISYGADADASGQLPVNQDGGGDNADSIALTGTGGRCSDFDWALVAPTPGTVNGPQTLSPVIVITSLVLADDGSIVLKTDGNAGARFTDFRVLSTTNLLLDLSAWDQPACVRADFHDASTFTLVNPPPGPVRYFAVQPLP